MTEQDAADTAADEREADGADQADGTDDADAEEVADDDQASDEVAETDPASEQVPDDDSADESDAVDEQLVERVAESDPEDIARELADLRTRVDGLEAKVEAREADVEELESKLKRKQADFQNFKKRMEQRREEEAQRAAADALEKMLDVRDNLVRALEQDADTDIRSGVESTLRQFDDVLESEGVDVVDPDPGAEVDPNRHQVLARVDSDQPEGTVADVHRAGYVMDDTVLREAQVTVSEGGDADE